MRHLKKIVVLIVGGTILLIGIVMIFLPGPSFIVIPLGLGILAVEFAWARSLLKKARHVADNLRHMNFKKAGTDGLSVRTNAKQRGGTDCHVPALPREKDSAPDQLP